MCHLSWASFAVDATAAAADATAVDATAADDDVYVAAAVLDTV